MTEVTSGVQDFKTLGRRVGDEIPLRIKKPFWKKVLPFFRREKPSRLRVISVTSSTITLTNEGKMQTLDTEILHKDS